MKRYISALLVALALQITSTGPLFADGIYDSGGFENFNLGALVGQTGGTTPAWTDFNPPNGNRFSVQSAVTNGGNRAVAATGASDIGAFVAPAVNYAPSVGRNRNC